MLQRWRGSVYVVVDVWEPRDSRCRCRLAPIAGVTCMRRRTFQRRRAGRGRRARGAKPGSGRWCEAAGSAVVRMQAFLRGVTRIGITRESTRRTSAPRSQFTLLVSLRPVHQFSLRGFSLRGDAAVHSSWVARSGTVAAESPPLAAIRYCSARAAGARVCGPAAAAAACGAWTSGARSLQRGPLHRTHGGHAR